MSDRVRAALAAIVEGGTLSLDEARVAMGAVMDGEATPAQLAALLMGLRMRGETVDELAGFATAMRERVLRVDAPEGAIDPATLPDVLRVTAMSEVDRVIMGIRHVALPLEGVQFHPESVLTPEGPHLLANFLRQAGEGEAGRLDAVSGSFATSGMAETPDAEAAGASR